MVAVTMQCNQLQGNCYTHSSAYVSSGLLLISVVLTESRERETVPSHPARENSQLNLVAAEPVIFHSKAEYTDPHEMKANSLHSKDLLSASRRSTWS